MSTAKPHVTVGHSLEPGVGAYIRSESRHVSLFVLNDELPELIDRLQSIYVQNLEAQLKSVGW